MFMYVYLNRLFNVNIAISILNKNYFLLTRQKMLNTETVVMEDNIVFIQK